MNKKTKQIAVGIVALALAGLVMLKPALASEPVSAEVQQARDALQNDPEIVKVTEQYELALGAWEEGLLCHLLQPWQEPEVRLGALSAVTAAARHSLPLQCPQWSDSPDLLRIRAGIFRDAQNSAPLLMGLYWQYCSDSDPDEWCSTAGISDRLASLNTDNAAVHLFPLISRNPAHDETPENQLVIKALLSRAAGASHFDFYFYHGLTATLLASEAYLKRHPVPAPPYALESAVKKTMRRLPSDDELVVIAAYGSALTQAYPSTMPVDKACRSASQSEDIATIANCLKIAALMKAAPTLLAASLGRRIESAVSVQNDQDGENSPRWRSDIRTLAFNCQRAKLLWGFSSERPMPASHLRQNLIETEALGESAAMQSAAQREFTLYPELFQVDPARCNRVYELDEATQQSLSQLRHCEEEHCGFEAAQEAMAELLSVMPEGKIDFQRKANP